MAARGLLAALSGLLLLHVLCAGLSVAVLTRPIRSAFAADPKSTLALEYRAIRFAARGDGTTLAAWYIPAPGSQRVIVFVHGKDSCKSCEFGTRALQFAKAMHDRGFSMLMLDLRGHGESDPAPLTYGLRERNDVLGAVDWLLAQGYLPGSIGVLGVSLGSASSLYAAAEEPAIGAVVSDSGYADIRSVAASFSERTKGALAMIMPLGSLLARWATGEDILSSAPIDQVARIAPRPILVIHGMADRLVAPDHAQRLAAAAGAEYWLIDGAMHARTYVAAPREYERRVGEFFARSLINH